MRKAGASAVLAKRVAEDVTKKLAISTKKIGEETVKLRKYNKKAVNSFEKFFKKKWRK